MTEKKCSKQRSGQSLVEVMVAMGLLAVGILGASSINVENMTILKSQRLDLARRRAFVSLARQISSPETLRNSLQQDPGAVTGYYNSPIESLGTIYWNSGSAPPIPTGNSFLYNCASNSSACDTPSPTYLDFVALGPYLDLGTQPTDYPSPTPSPTGPMTSAVPMVISGTSAVPLPYDRDGNPCGAWPTIANCPVDEFPYGIYSQISTECEPVGATAPYPAPTPSFGPSILTPTTGCHFSTSTESITVLVKVSLVDFTQGSPPPVMMTLTSGTWLNVLKNGKAN